MAIGQGINNWLRYADIAKAGAPQSLGSDALVELGALFTQLDFKTPKEDEESGENNEGFTDDFLEKKLGITDKGRENLANPLVNLPGTGLPTLGVLKERVKPTPPPNPVNDVVEETIITNDNVVDNQPPRTFIGHEGGSRSMTDRANLKYQEEWKKILTDPKNVKVDVGFNLGDIKKRKVIGDDTVAFRFKDDSPLERVKREQPEIFEALKGLRYTRRGDDDSPLFRAAHISSSPFVKTDELDYRQMRKAVIPEYAQRLGGAAAAGYNLVIDKYNYDQKVKADYDEELEDQMGSLNVDAEFVGAESKAKYMEVSMQKKKELSNAFNEYANGNLSKLDYENLKNKLYSDVNNIAQAGNNLTKLRQDFLDKKGTFDIDASDSEMVDFYNTLEKNPDNLTVATIDGVDYITGKTKGGKDIKVPASKIANGTAGFKLVEKVSLSPIISGAVKSINTNGQRTIKTEFGYGTASATPEKAEEIGVATIKASLAANENDLRSAMAQIYGVDHTAYQSFIGDNPEANKSEMLQDAAEHLYRTQVRDLVFEKEKTTRFVTQQQQGGKLTAAERQARQLSQSIGKLPTPTESNFNQYKSFIDPKYDYKIDDGKLLIGLKGKKKAEISLTDSNFKTQFSQFTKLPAFVGQEKSNQVTGSEGDFRSKYNY